MTIATGLELDTISTGGSVANDLLDLYDKMTRLNEVFDSNGGVKSTITQQKLDEITSFSGLTIQQLEDGMYPVTTTVKTAIQNSLSQLIEFAARVK